MSINRRRLGLGVSGLALLGGARTAAAKGPEVLRLVSGDFPPLAIERDAKRPGVLVELSEAVLRHAGYRAKAEFFPWARAQQMAQQKARSLIVPLTRAPEREARFQWLLKLYVQNFVFINRSEDPPVSELPQAQKLRIAVLRGSPNMVHLLNNGIPESQIVQASSVEDKLKLLERKHVDALYGGEQISLDKARSSGRDPAALQVGLRLDSREIWLAGGHGFTDADRDRLESSYRTLLRNGSVERLFRSYGIRPRPEDLR